MSMSMFDRDDEKYNRGPKAIMDTYYPSVNPNDPNEKKRKETLVEIFDGFDLFITGYYDDGSSVEYEKRYEGGKLVEKTEYHKRRSNSNNIYGRIKKGDKKNG